jgi:hypothetical protein
MAMSKLNAAYNKMSKLGGPGDKEPKQKKQVDLKSKGYFEGPFAKMKAKKAIKKGDTDVAVAVKNPKGKSSMLNPLGMKTVTTFKDYIDTNRPTKARVTKESYIESRGKRIKNKEQIGDF